MNRAVQTTSLAAALLLLAGCGAIRGRPETAAAPVSTEEFLATLPAEKKQDVLAAETDVREAERQASRAQQAVALAEQRLREARAEIDARKAEVERAQAQLGLIRRQYQAQLEGAPAGGQVPQEMQAATQRLNEAEHAVEVARWEQDRAQSLAQLRERELNYARAFREAADRQVDVQRAELELVKAQTVVQNSPGLVEGVVDPRVARAQAALREAQANYARAHADATQRLAEVQLGRQTMARFQSGPPPMLPASAPGQSGTAQLAPKQRQVELTPLPWPTAWQAEAQPPAPGQTGTGTAPSGAAPPGSGGAASGGQTRP